MEAEFVPDKGRSKRPVITLWQPWASWISLEWKTIETRTHARFRKLEGDWVGIHAGLKWDKNALHIASKFLTSEQLLESEEFKKTRGVIICVAHVGTFREMNEDDSKNALIECETKRFGLIFDQVQVIEEIKASGRQGIWYHDVDLSTYGG